MTKHLQPWHIAFVWAVGWVNRQRNLAIDYLYAENRVLREQVGKKRILLTDDQRRRLAVKGKELGRKGLEPPTQFCVGIGSWWQRSGTTTTSAKR